ncbi:MAG: DNA replication/repair protein RecF [Candidatus Sericytochromatia bacterium]
MFIKKLNLLNFRNYKSLQLDNISSARVVLIGDNAQGKSNLIEAIYCLAFGVPYRAKKETDLILWNEKEAGVYTELDTNLSTKELSVIFRKNPPKVLKVDGLNVKRLSKFVGFLKIVLFSAEDLMLLKGSPSERRSFMDKLLVQVYPHYYHQLQVYNKLIQQRNSTLKGMRENNSDDYFLLSVWDDQIVEICVDIYRLRVEFIKEISKIAEKYHENISNSYENISIKYISSISSLDCENFDEENYRKIISDHLANNYKKEILRTQSLYGPHRDDIEFFINNKEVKTFASQGQQRTLVLALKLSEIYYIKNKTNETPILLLDDVMAELDKTRQKKLLELVGNDTQTFLTTTHLEDFSDSWLKESTVLKVENGEIVNS